MNHVNTNEELFYTNWHAADKWRCYRLVFYQIKTFHSQLKTENVSKVEQDSFLFYWKIPKLSMGIIRIR